MKSLHQSFQSSNSIPRAKFFSSLSFFISKTPQNPEPTLPPLHPPHSTTSPPPNQTFPTKPTKTINTQFSKSPIFQHDDLTSKECRLARRTFDEMPHPDLTSYNLTISSHNCASQFDSSLRTFKQLHSSGLVPDEFTYGSMLSACVASQNLEFGAQLHSVVSRNGFLSNGYVLTGLVDLFSKNGRFGDALRVFGECRNENVVCWNAVIAGGVRNGENLIALELFHKMVGGFCMPNGFTFSSLLSACAALGELEVGRGLHAWILKCNVKDDVFVGTGTVDLYAKCGDMEAASKVFSRMPVHNVVSWTAMISGFVQRDELNTAIELFRDMIRFGMEINKYTLTSVLMACSKSMMVKETTQIHCWTSKNGLFMDYVVKEAFVNAYAKIGNLQMLDKVFEEVSLAKDIGTWSAMISGLAQNNTLVRSAELFRRMLREGLKPDMKCCSSVVSITDSIDFGTQIHSYTVKAGLVLHLLVGSALFTMYSKCGSIEDSYELFLQMQEKDTISWASMLSGFAARGLSLEAFTLFREMILEGIVPDEITLSQVLMVCCGSQFLMQGKEIHGHALHEGLVSETLVGSSLISMYSKCGALPSARRVFDRIPHKDQETWSYLVSGYSINSHNEMALFEFQRMLLAGYRLDHITASSVLGVCAQLSRPSLGRQLHAYGIKGGLICQLSASTALVMMYSKCGSIDDSRKAFDEIEHPDSVTWTAMVDGYAQNGMGLEALKMFELMKRDGVKPDPITFVSVLVACSHNGLVEDGFIQFHSMGSDYEIEPQLHHYACMVDLLGRSGRLKEAVDFIDKMPMEPDWLVWNTLLGACGVHGDVELGRVAAKKLFELEPCNSGAYISFSNISADNGNWEEVVRIRRSLNGIGVKKKPGWSFV